VLKQSQGKMKMMLDLDLLSCNCFNN